MSFNYTYQSPSYITCEVLQKKDTAVVIFPPEVKHIVTEDIKTHILQECQNKTSIEIVNYLCTKWGWAIKTQSDNKYVLQHIDYIGSFERDYNILLDYERTH